MPKYVVNMESQEAKRPDGSPHVRVTRLEARDKNEAQAICERRELQIAAHEYPPDIMTDLEQQEADADAAGLTVPAQVRMQLATHRQSKPYEVVSVEKVS
jgi:hypothetical protein